MDTCKRMWTKDELAGMAGGKIYRHLLSCTAYNDNDAHTYHIAAYSSKSDAITTDYVIANQGCLVGAICTVTKNADGTTTFDRLITDVQSGPEGYFVISAGGLTPGQAVLKITNDSFGAL